MTAARMAIEVLVARVQRRAADFDVDLRAALEFVLGALDVTPGDPAWANGRDVVGEAYEALVSTASRRELGQFFTPLWAARPMAEWLLAEQADLLLDPGCGSGSLLIGAAQARGDSATRLLGLDIDPLALRMAQVTRHVRRIDALDLRQSNFLLDDVPERPQAIICNPPYTRHQAVSAELKAAIHEGLSARLHRDFSQLASMHVLFLLRALEVSADDARIAFLTPAHWLDMNYARKIKALLLERAHVEAIVSFPVEDQVFDHAATTAGVTLIRKGRPDGRPTRVVRLAARAGEAELRTAIAADTPHRSVILRSKDKWSRSQTEAAAHGVTLGDLARVRRGIATGCNAFFVLSEKRRRELAIDADDVIPCIASPKHFAGAELRLVDLYAMSNNVPRWMLRVRRTPHSPALARYLERGRAEFGVLERTLTRQRVKAGRQWFEVELDVVAPILFRYLNASSARFVRNRALAAPLNNWLVIQPKPGVDADALFRVLEEAGDSPSLEEDSRHYGKGLWKLEPSELAALPLPAAAHALKP